MWAEEVRQALGNGLRYDPGLTTGKTVIEVMVEQIQEDARSVEQPEAVTAQPNDPSSATAADKKGGS